jgi:hypothetical protein
MGCYFAGSGKAGHPSERHEAPAVPHISHPPRRSTPTHFSVMSDWMSSPDTMEVPTYPIKNAYSRDLHGICGSFRLHWGVLVRLQKIIPIGAVHDCRSLTSEHHRNPRQNGGWQELPLLWIAILVLPSVSCLYTRPLDTNDVSMTRSLQRMSSSSKQQFGQTLSHKTGSTELP